jgi:hypothetical protein
MARLMWGRSETRSLGFVRERLDDRGREEGIRDRTEPNRFNAAVDVAHVQKPGAKLLGESAERKKDFSEISAYRNSITRRGNRRHAAEQRDELAPLQRRDHSITSSARASSVGGISSPSALAVLRLMTRSYLVGACTGRSAGFSPLRMRST